MSKIISNRPTEEQPDSKNKYEGDHLVFASIFLIGLALIIFYAIVKGN